MIIFACFFSVGKFKDNIIVVMLEKSLQQNLAALLWMDSSWFMLVRICGAVYEGQAINL